MEWRERKVVIESARAGAQDRLRPILMTACAMTVGMVPMALALEHGSEMEAPLGRAVIGGLLVSTFVTLFIVPSVFALLLGRRTPSSPSLYPDDPESSHYAPEGRALEATARGDSTTPLHGHPEEHPDEPYPAYPLAAHRPRGWMLQGGPASGVAGQSRTDSQGGPRAATDLETLR